MSRILLVDGSGLIYRSFYAFIKNPLRNSKGENTSAAFGYTKSLLKVLDELNPEYAAVSFDLPKPTERHLLFKEYKAKRPPMPDELKPQVGKIKEITLALGLPIVEVEGYEADDVIATLAKLAREKGFEVIIFSMDKDIMQVLSPGIKMLNMRPTTTEFEWIEVPDVKEKFGVPPELIPDYLGLSGDTSDNIPGVPGIGPKTAKKLLEEYGSLEKVLENVDRIPGRIGKLLKKHKKQAEESKYLAVLKLDVPVQVKIEDLKRREVDKEKLIRVFQELEFYSLLKELSGEGEKVEFEEVEELPELEGETISVIPCVKDGWVYGFSVSSGVKNYLVRRKKPVPSASFYVLEDAKNTAWALEWEIPEKFFDIALADYLLHPLRTDHSVERIALEMRGVVLSPSSNSFYPGKAYYAVKLWKEVEKRLEEEGLLELYYKIELPLVRVLFAMEKHGIMIDVDFFRELSRMLERELEDLEKEIFGLAGLKFNIRSPKQLSDVLFKHMGLPPVKKTKTGYSTDSEVLAKLAEKYEIARLLLSFRELDKLRSTYIDVLPTLVNPETGRIHASFNQMVTATGRLSSSNPNLQNIPIKGDLGKEIRKGFIAPPGKLIISADYSQIELRILAHVSSDENLIRAFKEGRDIHSNTASLVFGVPPDEITHDMRRKAKVVNFGIVYGMSPYGLSKELGIDVHEAERFIKNYFSAFPGVEKWIREIVKFAKERGYVRTLFGRKREIPELRSPQRQVREYGERIAINTPIQGTAADIIKLAMVNLHRRFEKEKMKSAMVLQIHDELVFEVPEEEREKAKKIIKEEMENAVELKVPLEVEIGEGRNWYEAH